MSNLDQKMKNIAPIFLRIGISLVFIWFGLQQIFYAEMWESYVPEGILKISPVGVSDLVHFNGAFEVVLGLCLFVGFFGRISALLLALHMAHITFIVGYDAIGVRDFGITIGVFTSFLLGGGYFSVDSLINKKDNFPVGFSPDSIVSK